MAQFCSVRKKARTGGSVPRVLNGQEIMHADDARPVGEHVRPDGFIAPPGHDLFCVQQGAIVEDLSARRVMSLLSELFSHQDFPFNARTPAADIEEGFLVEGEQLCPHILSGAQVHELAGLFFRHAELIA